MFYSEGRFEVITKSPATEKNLYLMPFYTGHPFRSVKPEKIHKSFYPDVSTSNLILNIRSRELLKQADIMTLGQLLLTPYPELLRYRNCGINTIEFLQREVKKYIIDKEIDYSANWSDMESMLENVLELKPRNLAILKYRLGFNLPKPLTLEERSEEHTSELQSRPQLVCRLLL